MKYLLGLGLGLVSGLVLGLGLGAEERTCVTSDVPTQLERSVAMLTARGGSPNRPFPPPPTVVRHGVFFHIVHRKDGTGKMSQQQIDDQVAQLNRAFSGGEQASMPDSRVRFFIVGVAYYEDDAMFFNCGPEEKLKQPNAVDTDTVLNVYTCSISMIVGDATMPGARDPVTFQVLPNNHWRYGIRLHYQAFTGGGLANLDQGDVLVHEIGHFYGLFHPYQDSCAPGAGSDRIDDTPRMQGNIRGSCAQNKGLKNCLKFLPDNPPVDISNYMVGTYDSCRNHFTRGQVAWMQQSLAINKPQLIARFSSSSTSSPPPTAPPAAKTAPCTWRIRAGVVGSPLQTSQKCQLPFWIGKTRYLTPPKVKQRAPFQYRAVRSLLGNDRWCVPLGTTKYALQGSTKFLWGPAECT